MKHLPPNNWPNLRKAILFIFLLTSYDRLQLFIVFVFYYEVASMSTVEPTSTISTSWELSSFSTGESIDTNSTSSELLFSAFAELCIRKKTGEC